MKKPAFAVAVSFEDQRRSLFEETLTTRRVGACNDRDVSQAGMGRKPEFSGLGLLGMRMGI
jgi:hypothetical protein